MHRLYWKIFLAFWSVIAVAVLITVTVNRIVLDDDLARTRMKSMQGSIQLLQRQAQAALTGGGEAALRGWLREHVEEKPGPPLFVVNGRGEDLLGRPLPPRLQGHLAAQGDGHTRGAGQRRAFSPAELLGPEGEQYRLVLPPFRPRLGTWSMHPQSRALFPAILLLVSGVICLLLARYLTRPIAELSVAGRRIANGDLGARVGGGVARRRDEFGDLARDFDDMAERIQASLDSRERLLRDVSHELRSPLTRLALAAALLRSRVGPEATADIERIEHEAENLDQLIGQILAYSRLQSQESVADEAIDLNALISRVVDDARFEGHTRAVAFQYDPVILPSIAGNATLLGSAIENVIRNALHHAQHQIDLSVNNAGDAIEIIVRDDGTGVDDAELPRLFEPFFTASRSSAVHGAGIGLAIAQRAIELHGGRISARNLQSGGLEVRIEIPVAAMPSGPADQAFPGPA